MSRRLDEQPEPEDTENTVGNNNPEILTLQEMIFRKLGFNEQNTPKNFNGQPYPALWAVATDTLLPSGGFPSTTPWGVFRTALTERLLTFVVQGKQDEAEAMISANPNLLLKEGEVIDYSGRTIEGSAFQMALGAEDVGFQPEEKCMAEMIAKHLDKHYPGEKEKQYEEQFPVGEGAVELWRQHKDLEALNTVVDAPWV